MPMVPRAQEALIGDFRSAAYLRKIAPTLLPMLATRSWQSPKRRASAGACAKHQVDRLGNLVLDAVLDGGDAEDVEVALHVLGFLRKMNLLVAYQEHVAPSWRTMRQHA